MVLSRLRLAGQSWVQQDKMNKKKKIKILDRDALLISLVTLIGCSYVFFVSRNGTATLVFFFFILFMWIRYIWNLSTKSMKNEYDDLMKMVKVPKGRND